MPNGSELAPGPSGGPAGQGRRGPGPENNRLPPSGARGTLGAMERPFCQVDVFADDPYFGNPLAVVLDATGLITEEMQRFAAWTNLSETTFVLPPESAGAD